MEKEDLVERINLKGLTNCGMSISPLELDLGLKEINRIPREYSQRSHPPISYSFEQ